MNSYVKTKVWLLTLAIVLLTQQLEAGQLQDLSVVDCGPNVWRLYNTNINVTERGVNVITDIAYGDNPSAVHRMNLSMPLCINYFPCRPNVSVPDFTKLFCDNQTNPLLMESCELVKNNTWMHRVDIQLPYCNEMVKCMKDNTYSDLEDVSCDSPNIDAQAITTCDAIKVIGRSNQMLQMISNANTTDFCWVYESGEIDL